MKSNTWSFFTVIFILKTCDAYHNFTDGQEYRFHVQIEQSLTGAGPDRDFNKTLTAYLYITEQPIGWLNCLMRDIEETGFPYKDEFYETFVVKVDNDKVDAIMGKGISTENGLKLKRELIQEIIKDRTDMKAFLPDDTPQDPSLRVELPFGSCKPEISRKVLNMQKSVTFKSYASDCDLLGKELAADINDVGIKKLSDESYTSIEFIVAKFTHFHAELDIFSKIVSTRDAKGQQIVMIKRMHIQFLITTTTNRYAAYRAETVKL